MRVDELSDRDRNIYYACVASRMGNGLVIVPPWLYEDAERVMRLVEGPAHENTRG